MDYTQRAVYRQGDAGERMRTRLKLKPGQRGTIKLTRQYGDRLLCVRYRYDAARQRRYKTVELVVDEAPWEPPSKTVVDVRVFRSEPVLRARVREAGGRWNRQKKAWELPYGAVRALHLEDRIIA